MAPTPGHAAAPRGLHNALTTKSIAHLLAPWMDVFYTYMLSSTAEDTVVVHLSADITKLLKRETNPSIDRYGAAIDTQYVSDGASRVWEAMQLLGYAVVLDPLVLLALSRLEFYHTTQATAAISKCKKCTLVFNFQYFNLDMAVLQESISKSFFEPTTSASSTLKQYQAVQTRLVRELTRRQLDDRLLEPLGVSFNVGSFNMWPSTEPNKVPTPFEAEDFLSHLTTFVLQVHQHHDQSHHGHDGHRAIRVEEVCLTDAGRLLITERVVVRAQDLMSKSRGLVTVSSPSLDPRAIACGTHALVEYLTTFQSDKDVTIGAPVDNHRLKPIDGLGEDRRGVLGTIMDAVTRCEFFRRINITPILALLAHSSNREFFWQKMRTSVLCGDDTSKPLEIVIDEDGHGGAPGSLKAEDAQLIRSAREAVGSRSTRVDKLDLTLNAVDESALVEFVGLLKDTSRLKLNYNGFDDALDSSTVSEVLMRCPSVTNLTLYGIRVDSMTVFADFCERRVSSGPYVESMRISNLYVADRDSFDTFMCAIGDESTAIGKHLHTLDMSQMSQNIDPYFALDDEALECVELALQTNRVLRDLVLVVNEDVSQELQDAVLKHNGDILICTKPDRDHNARMMAFLGAIKYADTGRPLSSLDTLIVQLVFEFCQPFEIRRVDIETQKPVE